MATKYCATHDTAHEVGVCRHCGENISKDHVIKDVWSHWHGDQYCHTPNGFCATPLHTAEPVLETEVL